MDRMSNEGMKKEKGSELALPFSNHWGGMMVLSFADQTIPGNYIGLFARSPV